MKLLVVGDIMLDRYVRGRVHRISPEAPVPVLDIEETSHELGGCGNVARNLVTMGADVTCWSAVGRGQDARVLMSLVESSSINNQITQRHSVTTTVKTRMVDSESGQQLLRCDKEKKDPIFVNRWPRGDFNAVVVSDYGKGFISGGIVQEIALHYQAPIIVDPHPPNCRMYSNIYAIAPNKKEYDQMSPVSGVDCIFETMGKDGIKLHIDGHTQDFPATDVPVYDVQGAGDTVVAVIAYCKGLGLTPHESARIAIKCAGHVVSQSGTSVVPKDLFDVILMEESNGS